MNTSKYNIWISCFIGLLPVLALYKIPGLSIGIGMFGLIVILPIIMIINRGILHYKDTLFPMLFFVYYMIVGATSINEYICWILVILWFLLARDVINPRYLFRAIIIVATIASILICVQTIFYYVFHFHLNCSVSFLLQDDLMEQYRYLINTGFITGMYRPSAFFLEPAHFGNYAAVGLIACLLYDWNAYDINQKRFKQGIILSIGMLLSTSGIGIALCFGIWILYILFGRDSKIRFVVTKKMLCYFGVGVVLCILLFQIPIVKKALFRINGMDGGYNAIKGRLFFWETLFSSISMHDWILGQGVYEGERYITGIMRMLYTGGIVLTSMFYLALLKKIFNKHKLNTIFAVMYGTLVVFTGMINVINMIFYILLIYIDYDKNNEIYNVDSDFGKE